MRRWWIHSVVCVGVLVAGSIRTSNAVEYPGPTPGDARASVRDDEIILGNDAFTCKWSIHGGQLKPVSLTDKHASMTLPLQEGECFQLFLTEGRILKCSDLKFAAGGVAVEHMGPSPRGNRSGGRRVRAFLEAPDRSVSVRWEGALCDGSNYVRQSVHLTSARNRGELREIALVQLPTDQAKLAGIVDGSPVVVGDIFMAFEHPLAKTLKSDSNNRALQSVTIGSTSWDTIEGHIYSSVMGVAPEGQLRRAFLYYVERERAQAYRPFLHYNSWYDIGYGGEKILEDDALKVIDLFGKELIEQRKVMLDSLVLDDGWDNPATLWGFHDGLPNGFTPLQQTAAKYGSKLGVWLSPWGGYGKPKDERMKYGQQEGFETNKRGFSMAGPKYYGRFRDVCLKMLRDYGVNYFKFDGISSGGAPTGAEPDYAGDVEALLRLISDLRAAKPDVFINVTTGTWSSPYWLWYADSTWRSGNDWGTCGWGSKRQQQITYRDNETYHNVVLRAPLYPINSLMTQGVMFANHGLPDEKDGMVEDIRAFFASGTNCQELYLTPSLLDAKTWDVLAEAAKWSRSNADVLVDTHWVGGDPIKGDVYGWASWSKRKGIVALRNPADKPGRIAMDIGKAFELPQGAAQKYSLKSPWASDVGTSAIELSAGQERIFELKPFEVLVFDATPL